VTDDRLPAEHLTPLAALVDEVLAGVGYEMAAATDAIDDAVSGYGGLFDPATSSDELRRALEDLLASGLTRTTRRNRASRRTARPSRRHYRAFRNTAIRIWPTATRTLPTHSRQSEPISRPSGRDSNSDLSTGFLRNVNDF